MAQIIVVVDVLITQGNGEHPLAQQRQQLVFHLAGPTRILKTTGQLRQQTQAPLGQIQEPGPAVGGNISAGKINLHAAPTTSWKFDLQLVTIRHRWPPR
jgi:hypothetical protein